MGVTRVGEVANTAAPLPVSSVSAAERLAEEKEPSEVALPTDVTAPVRLALVTTVAANEPVPLPVTPPVRVMVWSPVFVPLEVPENVPFCVARVPRPNAVRASGALVAPVPPLAKATVPVTLDAVPVVFWLSVGKSAATAMEGTPVVVVFFRMPVASPAKAVPLILVTVVVRTPVEPEAVASPVMLIV